MIIPVFHCFDDRYAAPAAVAFLSMLEHADPLHDYLFYVAHEDITQCHQMMLKEVVGRFKNAKLEFIVPKLQLDRYWSSIGNKAHYSKEVLYKLTVSDLFPQYDRMIVTDVDCLYCDDVSHEFVSLLNDESFYIAGVTTRGHIHCGVFDKLFNRSYGVAFSTDEQVKLRQGVGGGCLICNLKRWRQDGLSNMLLEYLSKNEQRLKQSEQDVLNLVCAGKIKYLDFRNMVCTYLWDWCDKKELDRLLPIIANPVQLHYATSRKPWNDLTCTKAHLWWELLARTPFFYEVSGKFRINKELCVCRFLSNFGISPYLDVWQQKRKHIADIGISLDLSGSCLGRFVAKVGACVRRIRHVLTRVN